MTSTYIIVRIMTPKKRLCKDVGSDSTCLRHALNGHFGMESVPDSSISLYISWPNTKLCGNWIWWERLYLTPIGFTNKADEWSPNSAVFCERAAQMWLFFMPRSQLERMKATCFLSNWHIGFGDWHISAIYDMSYRLKSVCSPPPQSEVPSIRSMLYLTPTGLPDSKALPESSQLKGCLHLTLNLVTS